MSPDGHGRDEEARRDLVGRQPLLHPLEDLPLAVGQLRRAPADERDPPPPLALSKLLDQERYESARQRGFPLERPSQREWQPYGVDVLQQVSGRPDAQSV